MPEGQDPYGSFAYYQRIRKEMLSAINFRRTVQQGTHVPYSNGYAPQQFVLSNPITHVDRVVTPMLRTRMAMTNAALAEARRNEQETLSSTAGLPQIWPIKSVKSQAPPALDEPESSISSNAIAAGNPRSNNKAPPVADPPSAPSAARRANSAAVVRNSRGGNGESNASPAADRDFSAKVAALEATLQLERENRLKVQRDLSRLERILAEKLRRGSVPEGPRGAPVAK